MFERSLCEKQSRVEEIYNSNKESVFRTCYMILKDYHLAEDATQETFMRVYCKLHTFNGRSEIKTWIIRIAVNVCKGRMRKKEYREIVSSDITENTSEIFDENAVEDKIVVVKAIMSLPLEFRVVIVLYYYWELSQKEIAKVLHIPQTTVAYRIHKAKQILKNDIREDLL